MNSDVKSSLQARLTAERLRWQLVSGWLGGWLMLAMAAIAIVLGWVMFLYLLLRPLRAYGESNRYALTLLSAIAVSAAFLGAILAIIIVQRQRREHALLRLAPNVEQLMVGLNARLALVVLLCLPPAITLPTLTTSRYMDSLDVVFSLAEVPIQDFFSSGLMLVYLAAIIVATFGWLRAPLRFSGFLIYMGAFQTNLVRWQWLPFVACVIIVIGHRIWLRTDMASVVRVNDAERRKQLNLVARMRSWRLQRAARAMGEHSSSQRVSALLATRRSALFTSVTVFALVAYMCIAPAFAEVSFHGYFFAYLVVALLATPTPIPLGQVMLLPIGAERRNVGRILMSVWLRDVRFRLLFGVTIGLLLRAILWWLDVFIFIRPPWVVPGDEFMQLVGTPLMNAAGLFGAAYALCWMVSASPRWLMKPGLMALLPMYVVVGLCALGRALTWALAAIFPELGSRDMSSLLFMLVNAAMIPALAWWVNRQLRPQWLNANLGAISIAMQAWSARRQKDRLIAR